MNEWKEKRPDPIPFEFHFENRYLSITDRAVFDWIPCITSVTRIFFLHKMAKKKNIPILNSVFFSNLRRRFQGARAEAAAANAEDEPCHELRRARHAKYRTHLFYLNGDDEARTKTDAHEVTWVAQLSLDRLQMVDALAKHWEGESKQFQVDRMDSIPPPPSQRRASSHSRVELIEVSRPTFLLVAIEREQFLGSRWAYGCN